MVYALELETLKMKLSDLSSPSKTCLILLLSVTAIAGCKTSEEKILASGESQTLEDPLLNDNCYAPTKKMTTELKDAWVKGLIEAAKDAERIHGIPAAALIAMASRESGYGTTRLYLGAKNAYGYKWSQTSAEGRPSWTLTCQPKADVGNQYIVFKNDWDAALFIGKKLSTMSRYKPATDKYIAARKAGKDVKASVDQWISDIADAGYNYDPPAYKKHLVKITNNYQEPSTAKSSSYNLYWISGAVTPRSK